MTYIVVAIAFQTTDTDSGGERGEVDYRLFRIEAASWDEAAGLARAEIATLLPLADEYHVTGDALERLPVLQREGER